MACRPVSCLLSLFCAFGNQAEGEEKTEEEHPLVANLRSHQEQFKFSVRLRRADPVMYGLPSWMSQVGVGYGWEDHLVTGESDVIDEWLGTYVDLYPGLYNGRHLYVREDLRFALVKRPTSVEVGWPPGSSYVIDGWSIWQLGEPPKSFNSQDVEAALFNEASMLRGSMDEPYLESLLDKGVEPSPLRLHPWSFFVMSKNGGVAKVGYFVVAIFDAPLEELSNMLKLNDYHVRPIRNQPFFPADLPAESQLPLLMINLHTLGSHHMQIISRDRNRSSITECFGPGYHPMLCCRPTDAMIGSSKFCWDDVEHGSFLELKEDRERCCSSYTVAVDSSAFSRDAFSSPSMATPVEKPCGQPLVDIFVRTFYKDAFALDPLLRSIAIFWPKYWGTTVYIAMDEGSKQDRDVCESLSYAFARCLYLPAVPDTGTVMFDNLIADLHIPTDPKYIAFVDADVVFHSYNIPAMLFMDGTPVIHASRRMVYLLNTVALGMDWAGEFMDSFPFLVERAHLAGMRSFIAGQMGISDFSDAFRMFIRVLGHASKNHAVHRGYHYEGDCPQQILGSFIFYTFRDRYHFSLEHGFQYSLPLGATCPALRVATHLWRAKQAARDYDNVENEEGQRNYVKEAHRIIQLGRQRFERPAMDRLLLSPDDLSDHMWKPSSSVHCGHRTVQRLLKWYFEDW